MHSRHCACRNCAGGLGFSIDWGGIIGNTVKAYGAVYQAKSAIKLQAAQQAAALRAQEAEIQLMQRRQAQMVAQPADGGRAVIAVPAKRPSVVDSLPPWAIPAGVGLLAVFLMRK